MKTLVGVGVAAALVVSACGSTVGTSLPPGRALPAETSELGWEQARPSIPGSAADRGLTGGAAPAGGRAGGATGPAGAATGPHRGSPTAASSGRSTIPVDVGVHGVTDSAIEVGLATADLEAAYATMNALSGAGTNTPEGSSLRKSGDAVVAHINSHGGIAGRRVVPIWYEINPANAVTASGRQQEIQRACATWTEDHQVFAVSIIDSQSEENMVECMAETNTVFTPVRVQPYLTNERVAALRDLYYAPSLLTAHRRERNLIDALWAQGFFTKGAKIAAMIEDKPGIRDGIESGLKPALAAHGLSLSAEIVYPDMIQSPWQNYVLQLQTAGITHVVMSTTTGSFLPTFFMMKAAEDQGYRPRYGIASDGNPNGLGGVGAPREQMARAQGLGWIPFFDTGDTSPQSDAGEVCASINEQAAQPAFNAEFYCEALFFWKHALDSASEVSPVGLSRAVAGLGDAFQSVWTMSGLTRLSHDRHDGPAHYRDLFYEQSCSSESACFKYAGPVKPLD